MLINNKKMQLYILSILIIFSVFNVFADEPEILQHTESQLNTLTNTVDFLIGGKRADDIRNQSTLRLKGLETFVEHKKPTHSFHINAVTKISTLERWQKQMTSWLKNEESEAEKEGKEFFGINSSHKPENAGGNKLNTKTAEVKESTRNPWIFSFDKNLMYHSQEKTNVHTIEHSVERPDKYVGFFAHARVRKDFEIGKFFNSTSQEFGWDTENRWETLGDLVTNFQISESIFASLTQTYNWFITKDRFATSHALGLRWLLNEKRLLIFDGGLGTKVNDGEWFADLYFLRATYREAFYRESLFIQVTPFINFSKIDNFKDSPGFMLAIELRI